ncbi:hypothetical protein P152DRAFT_504780 [Eremomyces bilateralis CBS 781.70]|uniref:Protein CFT1 n=1 Tax=Eremomyces bilateralis CBS 781.70 TaxID=1392243 RepID=A0A6G1GI66_9PEZI|nr:uncharacterized protein P152DRAFT_504780 [Eremomyces bilateralis CBS 781.70]KAF1817591.1 hypothetical protein P152DRAFT_504780 [Eremomyces bilateralis CBS 781.70]
MQCYTELTPATAVTHSVSLPFLSPKTVNLAVVRTNILQIYELKTIVTEVERPDRDDEEPAPQDAMDDGFGGPEIALERTENTTKLSLRGEYVLAGTVTAISRVKLTATKSGGEALLIAFRDAKLSLVEWDPEIHSISTISIHFYEGEGVYSNPSLPEIGLCSAVLAVDPSSRCAALKFGVRNLAILPFRQAGDDLVDEDYDPDMDEPMGSPSKAMTNGVTTEENPTPYMASFVLPLTAIDASLLNPVHLVFLHEYREPTFGIIYSTKTPSAALIAERPDTINFAVFTLDLEQRASTALLSISGLPYDLFQAIALPLPIGGALLVGGNELLHVDQSGRTVAVAVNPFAKQCSSFPMADQSELGLRLEGSVVEQLGGEETDLLIVLNTGELAIVSFKMDGRTVSGLHVQQITQEQLSKPLPGAMTCSSLLSRGRIFLGSEQCDAHLISWSKKKTTPLGRKRSHAEFLADADDMSDIEEEDDDEDDDLYAAESKPQERRSSGELGTGSIADLKFRIHDTLPSIAPIHDFAIGSSSGPTIHGGAGQEANEPLDLVAAYGGGESSGLAILNRSIHPVVQRESRVADAKGLWAIHARKPAQKGFAAISAQDKETNLSVDADYDRYMFVSKSTDDGTEETLVYTVTPNGLEETTQGDFEVDAGAAIEVGLLANNTRIVQVLNTEIRSYDSELALQQIMPMEDEETSAELNVLSCSFCDPYVLVIRDDGSCMVLEADQNGDIDEKERGDTFKATKWVSGCLYRSSFSQEKHTAFLVGQDGALCIFDVNNLATPLWSVENIVSLPSILSSDQAVRRSIAKDNLTQVLMADIGDDISKSPHLFLLNELDDIITYRPYHTSTPDTTQPFTNSLRWQKVSHEFSRTEEDSSRPEGEHSLNTLRLLKNVAGYSIVSRSGQVPLATFKETSSVPKFLPLAVPAAISLTEFHTADCDRGFAYLDRAGVIRFCQLPAHTRFGDIGWACRRVPLGMDARQVCYDPVHHNYVVGCSEKRGFKLPDDEMHHEWSKEGTAFLPQVEQGYVKLVHPETWVVIDDHELETNEVVICMESMNLEVNENTHERRQMVGVGTAMIRGEDLAMKGAVYIFEVIDVVPEPGRPETGQKLRLVVREEVKGAVTAVSEIGAEGYVLVAQGQKMMVRGLKEDNSLLPVAFLDINCYATVAKTLRGSGLVMAGDLIKGLWLVGYTEQPYRMILFGKTKTKLEVTNAEFLPVDKQLYLILTDPDCNLHVLQFDPEDPKSLSGQRLLPRSTFHTGHFSTKLSLLPYPHKPFPSPIPNGNHTPPPSPPPPAHQILQSTHSGSLALLTSLSEDAYRRLSAVQTYLGNVVDAACGLNARAYRAVESEGFGSRGVLDGSLLGRWGELSGQRRGEGCGKVGAEAWVVRGDLESIGGVGLGFL